MFRWRRRRRKRNHGDRGLEEAARILEELRGTPQEPTEPPGTGLPATNDGLSPPGVAVRESLAATAHQDSAAVEASLALDQSTRRLIQRDSATRASAPAHGTACSARGRGAAIHDWQQSRGASPTGYLNAAKTALPRAAGPSALPEAPSPPQALPAVDPSALPAAAPPASTPEADVNPPPASVAAEVDPQLPRPTFGGQRVAERSINWPARRRTDLRRSGIDPRGTG